MEEKKEELDQPFLDAVDQLTIKLIDDPMDHNEKLRHLASLVFATTSAARGMLEVVEAASKIFARNQTDGEPSEYLGLTQQEEFLVRLMISGKVTEMFTVPLGQIMAANSQGDTSGETQDGGSS